MEGGEWRAGQEEQEQCDPWLVCAPGSDMNVALSPHRTQEGGQSCQRTIPGAECPGPWLMS